MDDAPSLDGTPRRGIGAVPPCRAGSTLLTPVRPHHWCLKAPVWDDARMERGASAGLPMTALPNASSAWLRRILLVTGAVLGIGMLGLTLQAGPMRGTPVLELLVGWSFVGCGSFIWRRRPANRLGPLMSGIGILWLLGRTLSLVGAPAVFTLGVWLTDAWSAGFALFLLSFPSGRLSSPLDRAIVGLFLFVTVPLEFAWFLFWEPATGANVLGLWPDTGTAGTIDTIQRTLIVTGAVLLVAVQARRWSAATPPVRRQMTPVLAGTAAILLASLATVLSTVGLPLGLLVWLVLVAYITIPIAVLWVVLRARMARAAVADLVVELGETPTPARLRVALANALGDQSLSVAYWSAASDSFVNASGGPVDLPDEGSGRAVTVLERAGRPEAAIIHDAILLDEPGLIASVASAMRLSVENDILTAAVEAQLAEVRASRSRIVAAADAERQRMERDLHDGAQQRLVSLTLALRLARMKLGDDADPAVRESLEAASAEAKAALAELRELARGIHPQILTEAGLSAAVDSLADRSPIPVAIEIGDIGRYPPSVEAAAYFLVAEALTNVAKYAEATRAIVRIEWYPDELTVEVSDDGIGGADPGSGSGLRGLGDRLSAVGGTLDIVSPPSGGTRLLARIPAPAPMLMPG
jgi:signal transduction histidine kinase